MLSDWENFVIVLRTVGGTTPICFVHALQKLGMKKLGPFSFFRVGTFQTEEEPCCECDWPRRPNQMRQIVGQPNITVSSLLVKMHLLLNARFSPPSLLPVEWKKASPGRTAAALRGWLENLLNQHQNYRTLMTRWHGWFFICCIISLDMVWTHAPPSDSWECGGSSLITGTAWRSNT